MTEQLYHPTKVQRVSSELVRVVWSDGHEGDYPVLYLRKRCPCATCSVAIRKSSLPGVSVLATGQLEVTSVRAVGNYALEFHFNDGHTTGIYSYEYLRGICPCPSCAKINNLSD